MMRRVPAALSLIALGAHFLRGGHTVLTVACVVACAGLFVRDHRVTRILQGLLIAGAGLWMHTAWRIAQVRMSAGAPWVRMALILGGVALFSLLSAWLLRGVAPRPSEPSG